ncbi:MAG: hypothetical protein NTW30_05840 [Candidatus Aenigmarchaeota archaeon]|nr:hypothetical protein [Candidatus Aenigmarchaeota archaeon]
MCLTTDCAFYTAFNVPVSTQLKEFLIESLKFRWTYTVDPMLTDLFRELVVQVNCHGPIQIIKNGQYTNQWTVAGDEITAEITDIHVAVTNNHANIPVILYGEPKETGTGNLEIFFGIP